MLSHSLTSTKSQTLSITFLTTTQNTLKTRIKASTWCASEQQACAKLISKFAEVYNADFRGKFEHVDANL